MKRYKKVYIEITNACNLSCEFCHGTKREITFMPLALFNKIILQIKDYTDYVYLHVLGEPLLHNDLEEFIDICHNNDIKVNITTNGTLIKKWSKMLSSKKNIRQINFSLHGLEQLKDWEEYCNNIFNFIKMEKENKIYFSLRLWNLELDEKVFNKNKKLIRKIEEEMKIEILSMKSQKISDGIYLHFANRFEWPSKEGQLLIDNGNCYGLRTHVGILSDGTVVPCCLDCQGEMAIGNIKVENFSHIIEKKEAEKMKKGFMERRFYNNFCKTCGFAKNLNRK